MIQHPSWRHAHEVLRSEGLSYGSTITAKRLGELLRAEPGTQAFTFALLELRQHIEAEDGLYLAQIEDGKAWRILEADAHESQAATFDKKVRRYAVRSVNLRSATLMNEDANLSPWARAKMEKSLEISATRLVLIARQQSIINALGPKAEKFLSGRRKPLNGIEYRVA